MFDNLFLMMGPTTLALILGPVLLALGIVMATPARSLSQLRDARFPAR
jgi:hypothetical protein